MTINNPFILLKKNLLLLFSILAMGIILAVACTTQSNPTESADESNKLLAEDVTEIRVDKTGAAASSIIREEEFPLPNCGGTGELSQTLGARANVQKGTTIGATAGTTIGGEVGLPSAAKLKLEAQVELAYQQEFQTANSRLDTIEMVAAGGSHVVYVIEWEEQEFASIVSFIAKGKEYETPYTYKLTVPKISNSYQASCPRTITPTHTQARTATSTPTTPIESPAARGEFPAGCISQDTWLPFPSEALGSPQNGCWNVPPSWGIYASGDELSIFQQDINSELSYGLVRAIPDQSDAKLTLNLRIEQMEMPGEQIHNVSFGVVSLSPEGRIERGLFFQKERIDFPILLKSTVFGDTYLRSESGDRYEYTMNSDVRVELVVDGNELNIYFNGEPVVGPLAIPASDRGFWIGYFMRTRGSLKVEITGLKVED